MTIIIGRLCQDGVVIGSDSSATFASGTTRTIEQQIKKVCIIDGHVIVAGTGQVGLGQRFQAIVEKYWKENGFRGKSNIDAMKELSGIGIRDFTSTYMKIGQYGALLAFAANSSFGLCEFALNDFQPELKTADSLWYVSMGCGQVITDPFLGLMRKVFWKDKPPRISEGIFAVYWALEHTIELNPGGINGPIQIAVLSRDSKGFSARLLEEGELSEHSENIEGAIEHLSKYKDMLQGKGQASVSDIPKSK